jgi:hypothetical protein
MGSLYFAFAAVVTLTLVDAQPRTMTVCELLDSNPRDRQEVTVRGWIPGNSSHAINLFERTGEPCPGWRRRFMTAPAVIGLSFRSGLDVKLTPEQERSNRDFVVNWARLRNDRIGYMVGVRLSGIVRRKPIILTFKSPRWPWGGGDQWIGNGFDVDGAIPLMIMLTSIEEYGKLRQIQ